MNTRKYFEFSSMVLDLELFKTNLGEHIAQLREKEGLTQAQLGALIDKDYQSISRIERGKVNVSGFTLVQIAEVLNVSMDKLFDFKKN
ncbi:helix-turn-helix domain-containing protein [Mucilaginibacter phyllosphaerae]